MPRCAPKRRQRPFSWNSEAPLWWSAPAMRCRAARRRSGVSRAEPAAQRARSHGHTCCAGALPTGRRQASRRQCRLRCSLGWCSDRSSALPGALCTPGLPLAAVRAAHSRLCSSSRSTGDHDCQHGKPGRARCRNTINQPAERAGYSKQGLTLQLRA